MKNSLYKILLAAVLGLSTIAPIATFAYYNVSTQEETSTTSLETKLLETINVDNMYNTIKYLSKTPRVAGSLQEAVAAQYIRKKFESYGYTTQIQIFTFNNYIKPHTIQLDLDGFKQTMKPLAFEYSVDGEVSAEVISAGLGTVDEIKSLNLVGKIALMQRGDISFMEKIMNVTAKGAVGVIIYNNAEGSILGSLGEENDTSVPAVLLTKTEGEALANHINKNPGKIASLQIKGAKTQNNTSHNVIATKKPTNLMKVSTNEVETHDIIVIGSHHDSVKGAPGANDNASGTSITLELARVLKNVPSNTEIRFITFGAEEMGLLGSAHYVENLSENDISRIVANFNLDMVGSKDAGDLILQTADNKSNFVIELAQTASTKLNGKPTPFNQGNNSDHVSFANVGIPAALFIHNPVEPWYHQPKDTLDKISKEKLQDVAEIVSLSVWNHIHIDQYAQ